MVICLLGLVDFEIATEVWKPCAITCTRSGPIRNAVEVRLPFRIGLQLEPGLLLLTIFSHRMQNHRGIADRLAVSSFNTTKLVRRQLVFIARCNRDRLLHARRKAMTAIRPYDNFIGTILGRKIRSRNARWPLNHL